MNAIRLLSDDEISQVSGGELATGNLKLCPMDEWWNPNWFTDDAGQIQQMPAQNGPIDGYWTDGNIWCVYDSNNNLLGVYKEDPNGTLTITYSRTDQTQDPQYNIISETGGSYTVKLVKIQ